MRRTYISPEYDYSRIYGTFNMKEESSIFGSKMLEIDDTIVIDDQSLVYFQSPTKEQLDLTIESSLTPISYSPSEDKRVNHTLVIDPSQSMSQRDSNTQYILTIDLKTILSNYIFATLKRWRTFEGVRNEMTKNGDIDFAIREYILKNVIDRYKLNRIELYLKYIDIQNQNILKFDNIWAGYSNEYRTSSLPTDIGVTQYQLKKFQSQTEFDYSSTIITFSQEKKSSEFCFDYFFKLFYEKI